MQASFFPPQCLPGLCSQIFSVNHIEILTLAACMLLCFALLSSLVEKSPDKPVPQPTGPSSKSSLNLKGKLERRLNIDALWRFQESESMQMKFSLHAGSNVLESMSFLSV